MAAVSHLSRVTSLLAEIGAEKQAAETELDHSGSASKDPGGRNGASTHPSAKLDGHTQAAPLGARFKENSEDMRDKRTVGNVDRTEGTGGGQDKRQFNIGTRQSATGEDPKTENNYKGNKEDPGTTHPANANTLGEKYGAEANAVKYASMNPLALTELAYDRINECLADMANGFHLQTVAPTDKTAAAQEAAAAAAAGYELAGAVARPSAPDVQEKQAFLHSLTVEMIKSAAEDADEVGRYLTAYVSEKSRIKQAEGEMPPMMGGGGGPPPEGPPPGMGGGGGPPPGMMGGMEGGGGPPPMPGGPEGGAGGGGDHEAALNELFNALTELGVPPQELEQIVAHLAGGGGAEAGGGGSEIGGPPPEAPPGAGGGEPPPPEKEAAARRKAELGHLRKLAGDVKTLQRAGKARLKEATPGSQLRRDRDEIKGYLKEVCNLR